MARQKKNKHDLPSRQQAEIDSWLEERLIASAWNEALSAISTGLAHDTNNCLTGILSMSDACLGQLDAHHPMRENLLLVSDSARKAAQLIQQLMRVHHEKAGKRIYDDLNRVTAETVELLKRVLRRQIELDLQLESSALPVYVDAVELQRIIILLSLDAAQTMQAKGKITFRTSLHLRNVIVRQFHGTLPPPPSVGLSMASDAGIGWALDTFLTDPFAKATPGNYNSVWRFRATKQFVEKHAGAISFEREEGAGMTVQVWLPQADFTEGENR